MARLEFSATRLEGREINVRNDRMPISMDHPVREINDHMDDIIYNAIDYIQERAEDNELRTYYFNMMSADGYRNSDFKKLVGMLADVLDIGMAANKFREVRDGIIPVVEDVIKLHIGYMTDIYPDLMQYVSRDNERNIDRAVSTYEKYMDAVDVYRRNGNRVPSRDRDRDDRDDRGSRRGRDRDRDINYGDDRGGRDGPRRDRWNRGAIRDGVHGSRAKQNRENRFGNTDQDDRFDDTTTSIKDDDRNDDRRGGGNRNRDDRDDRNSRRDRNDDRFENTTTDRPVRSDRDDRDMVSIQRLPGSRKDSDVEDALARTDSAESDNSMSNVKDVVLVDSKNPIIAARSNQDAWSPSKDHPHPLAHNHTQELFYEMELIGGSVIPHLVKKDTIVDYHAHASLSFGDAPRDFRRYEDGGVNKRLNTLHESLLKPSEEVTPEGAEESVTVHHRIDETAVSVCFSLKEMLAQLNYRRFAAEHLQKTNVALVPIDLIVGKGFVVEVFMTNQEEYDTLAELREEKTFVKLCEKLRIASKTLRPELFLMMDQYLTKAINRMMRQYMSIPATKISSFTTDWLELFALISKNYGEAYRDAIVQNQEREIKHLLNYSPEAELLVDSTHTAVPGLRPFIIGVSTKVFYINEVGYNLDLDMMKDVASALLPETNPFFHDLAQDLLTKGDDVARFFIQTSDMRVIEASRSYLNDRAVLLRMVQ